MSIHQHATLEDTVYLWFAANDTSGSGGDGASPVYDVRLAGAAADAAPVLSGSAALLTHANYPAGAHEIGVAATAGNGFAATNTYAVFCTLLVDSQNPTGFVGSFTLAPIVADLTHIHGTALTETAGQLAGRFKDFFDQDSAGYNVKTALSSFKATGFLDAAGVRTAVGLGSANLDTQLADVPTVAEFEARTIVSADYFVVGDYTAPDNTGITNTYNIVNHGDYGNAKLVRSTTPANTLDVSATGEAGLDFANIKDSASNTATIKLKQLDIQNSAGTAFVAKSTGSNGHGMDVAGNGTGEGIVAIGGATGDGICCVGGATTGHGMMIYAETEGTGITVAGKGAAGHGIYTLSADNTGNGIYAEGGPSGGAGIKAAAQANNDAGMELVKHGTGKDLDADWNPAWDAEVQSEVQDALEANNLDHWVGTASGIPSVVAGTYLDQLMDDGTEAYDRTTDSLQAIRDRGDNNWQTGGGGSISDILNIHPLIPLSIDLANTAAVRLGLMLVNSLDDLPSTAEITPGTIDIHRKAIGGTSWSAVVNGAACSEIAGQIYYDEVFDSGTGYAEGDTIRITFKSQKITVAANDFEIVGATGRMFYTSIRQTMRGTDSASTHSAADVADAVWDEAAADHDGEDTMGEAVGVIIEATYNVVDALTVGAIADQVWDESALAHLDANSTGRQLYTVLNAVPIAAEVNAECDTALSDWGKTGFKLASDGLDTVATTEPSGVASNFREMLVQTWRRFFKKSTLTATQLKTYKDDASVGTTQTVSDDDTTQTQGAAS